MKTKKIVSLLLALVMVMALAVPAFAADPTPNVTDPSKLATGITTKVSGVTTAGNISIVVPTTGTVVVNPYKLSVTASGTEGEASDTKYPNQVISPWQAIQNLSATTDIDVSATITGTPAGDVKLSAATTMPEYVAAGETGHIATKEIWAFLETNVAATAKANATSDIVAPTTSTAFTDTDGYFSNVLIGTKGTATKVGKIDKVASNSKSFLNFHINGVANQFSTAPWTTRDKLDVSIVFTFAPNIPTT